MTSVCKQLQDQVYRQVKDLMLAEIRENITICNQPFSTNDIRPGGYLSPEGREPGKCTNERDEWGYKWQCTFVRGSGSVRSDEQETWMMWLQLIVREFNHRRLKLPACITNVHFSRSIEAKQINATNDELKKRGYDAVGVLITVWVREPRA